MRKTKFKGVTDNVTPLMQREGKMNTRKGMKENKAPETSEDDSLVPDYAKKYFRKPNRGRTVQLPLFGLPDYNQLPSLDENLATKLPDYARKHLQLGESETKGDLTQPDYLIKGDIA